MSQRLLLSTVYNSSNEHDLQVAVQVTNIPCIVLTFVVIVIYIYLYKIPNAKYKSNNSVAFRRYFLDLKNGKIILQFQIQYSNKSLVRDNYKKLQHTHTHTTM